MIEVGKGSETSVLRFGLVGPNCNFNLIVRNLCGILIPCRISTRKGKWLIFHYFSVEGLKMETSNFYDLFYG